MRNATNFYIVTNENGFEYSRHRSLKAAERALASVKRYDRTAFIADIS